MKVSAVIKKEFRQIIRDKRTLFLILILPGILVILFGYALSFDVKHIKVGFIDFDKSNASRELINSLISTEYFDLIKYYENQSQIERALDLGEVTVGIIIPSKFENKIEKGESPQIQALIDGSNAQMSTIIQGYLNAFILNSSIKIVSQQIFGYFSGKEKFPVNIEPRIWYNPELKSSLFLIPGLIVYIIIITSTISTAVSVVKEVERGTIEQLLVSPLTSTEVIIGKTIPYIFLGMLDSLLILLVGYLFFDLSIKGSFSLLFISLLLFILAGSAQGILISTITNSQQVAFQMASLLTMLPTLLLSGFIFPIRNMVIPLQLISYIVPARYFINVIRGILLKGVGFNIVWKDLLFLSIFTCIIILGAVRRLSKAKLI